MIIKRSLTRRSGASVMCFAFYVIRTCLLRVSAVSGFFLVLRSFVHLSLFRLSDNVHQDASLRTLCPSRGLGVCLSHTLFLSLSLCLSLSLLLFFFLCLRLIVGWCRLLWNCLPSFTVHREFIFSLHADTRWYTIVRYAR